MVCVTASISKEVYFGNGIYPVTWVSLLPPDFLFYSPIVDLSEPTQILYPYDQPKLPLH